jgi:hypothetical protein
VLAILIPAAYHGTYDSLTDTLPWVSLLVATISIVALAIYTAQAEQLEAWLDISLRDKTPVAAPSASVKETSS